MSSPCVGSGTLLWMYYSCDCLRALARFRREGPFAARNAIWSSIDRTVPKSPTLNVRVRPVISLSSALGFLTPSSSTSALFCRKLMSLVQTKDARWISLFFSDCACMRGGIGAKAPGRHSIDDVTAFSFSPYVEPTLKVQLVTSLSVGALTRHHLRSS